jgi:hypothetical protein
VRRPQPHRAALAVTLPHERHDFAPALVLFVAWAIATISRGGSNVRTSLPTMTIVDTGPYRRYSWR